MAPTLLRPLAHATALGVVALTALAASLLGQPALAHAASASLPVTITNDTGVNGPVYVYILGEDTAAAPGTRLGHVDASGAFQPWPAVAPGAPVEAPDVALTGPSDGSAVTLQVPANISGRIYYSVGEKLRFQLVRTGHGTTGLVQPGPWNAGDSTAHVLFDWVELTHNGTGHPTPGLWINSTQVDQLAVPARVDVVNRAGARESAGAMVPGGRQSVIDTLRADPAWSRTIVTGPNGRILRVLAPGHATSAGLLSPTYLDPAIARAWDAYRTRTLTVRPFPERPEVAFFGRTEGDVLSFTDAAGATVAAFQRPSSTDVWGCEGATNGLGNAALPNDQTTGPISRTLCAALNRGTLGTSAVEPVTDPAAFYPASDTLNLYSAAVHAAMVDGRAYAFAFDDVGGHESLVHEPRPARIELTLQSLGGGAEPTPTPTPTGSPEPTPTPAPTASPEPTPAPDRDAALEVVLGPNHPGWATLTLGEGTEPGLVSVAVSGGRTSTVAVNGPGSVRVDLTGPTGTRLVTLTSSAALGGASLALPASATPPAPSPTATPTPTPTPTATPASTPSPAPTGTPAPEDAATHAVEIAAGAPGWATLELGAGTAPGLVTVAVEGGSTATVAVGGPGLVRTDLSAPAGSRLVRVTSTGAVGRVAIHLP